MCPMRAGLCGAEERGDGVRQSFSSYCVRAGWVYTSKSIHARTERVRGPDASGAGR